ncbi:Putative transcriptional regulator%2C GntR family [Mycobacterium tuberculosis]|nr:Putative transcriptional regulator%2C GntR family [Mycobacterium tuberculosis]
MADHLAGRIAAKEFDRRLPGVRALADEYGVSHTTVSDALRELSHQGLVVTTQGRGTFVQTRTSDASSESSDQPGM